MKGLVILLFVMMISGVFAGEYHVQFTQVGDKVIEKVNNLTSFVSSEGLDRTGTGYYFIKKIVADNNYSILSVRLILEEGVAANPSEIFPANYVSTSDGQMISLVWNYYNVSQGDKFAFFVSLTDTKMGANYSGIYYVLIILILFVGGFSGFRYFVNKRKNMDKYLLDEEKKVIKLLAAADGKGMWQKNIQSSLNFSKAKLSRMIRNLESRGLIEKIPVGNTNKIRLK